jgi:hypothetical protein
MDARFSLKTLTEESVGRPSRRREDNTEMDYSEIGCEIVDSIHLTQHNVQW